MLTDEQMKKIWDEHGPQDMALQEAYRLGMLRAAEIVFNIDDTKKCLHKMPQVDALERIGYQIGLDHAECAIRAEANAAKQQQN